MPLPIRKQPYQEKDSLDHSIDHFVSLEEPTLSDLHRVVVSAQVQEKIDRYRSEYAGKSAEEYVAEQHNSSRLREFLGTPPHSTCHAHAIVSGDHPRAAAARAVLAWFEMRIDDPHNGCWLPENTAAKKNMPEWLRGAAPHSRIHRNGYYFWLDTIINIPRVTSLKKLVEALREIRTKLQNCTFPSTVMLSAVELRKQGKM